ncbi:hypothetical protein [Thermospira aquatica]|uniref:Capsule assembly Wzi family protein n=1 Tax=Thermospira aquatica TaxID=2828656 RepID=A0AAX3BEG3_9SPIR|nr:hypothetical protein [Thermospira aquatica]URA10510.1 hypothetical protein KDW03_01530 [Thermospira aquatica]
MFFVGSHPALSIVAFPQDLTQWEKPFFAVGISYQSLPWWGDMDNPTNRPNEGYTSTEENIYFPPQEGEEQSYFQTYGTTHLVGVTVQSFSRPEKNLFLWGKLSYLPRFMVLSAEGNLRGETNTEVHFIPFSYSASHLFNALSLEGIVASIYQGIPLGLKMGFSYENTGKIEHSFNATVNGTHISSERLLWGWTTVGCNHIFGYPHINGDAWFQNSYLTGPVWQWDIQAGISIPQIRFGNRFRLLGSLQQETTWQMDTNATTLLETNFSGNYTPSLYLYKTDGWLNRTYANVTWKDGGIWKLNTLFFLGLDSSLTIRVLSNDLASEGWGKTKNSGILIEVNPNVSIKPSKQMLMDLALLISGEWHRTEKRGSYYNPLMGTSRESWQNSTPVIGPEYSWEGFSYVDTTAFHLGVDMIFYLPLYGNKDRQIGLVLNVFENTQFSWLSKYYGTNRFTQQETSFDIVAIRSTFRREAWLHTMVGIQYRQPPYQVRCEFLSPLLYSLAASQKLQTAAGEKLYEAKKSQNWAVQEGLALRITVAHEF